MVFGLPRSAAESGQHAVRGARRSEWARRQAPHTSAGARAVARTWEPEADPGSEPAK